MLGAELDVFFEFVVADAGEGDGGVENVLEDFVGGASRFQTIPRRLQCSFMA